MNITLKKPLVYVTRDIERALGMEPGGDYSIVSNDTAYGRQVQSAHPESVTLLKGGSTLDTYELLELPEAQAMLDGGKADLVVFQNTPRIERLAQERGWSLLNPSAELAKRVEEKVSQVAWLGEDTSLLPPHRIAALKDVRYEGAKFVLQFNHSHTGQGTFVIESAEQLAPLAAKFPDRQCRVTRFVEGPVFTVNAVVDETVVVGNPSYQITGVPPFTDLPFSTVGNDWSLARRDEYEGVYEAVRQMALKVGLRLKSEDWHGLFGIDAIYDEMSGKTYLLEINARQPASAVYESALQKRAAPDKASLFEMHISALCGSLIPVAGYYSKPIMGAQIVRRVTSREPRGDVEALAERGLDVIAYENSEPNKELYRVQASAGIMERHKKLGELGNFIATCLN